MSIRQFQDLLANTTDSASDLQDLREMSLEDIGSVSDTLENWQPWS